jgi:hypothetical protein
MKNLLFVIAVAGAFVIMQAGAADLAPQNGALPAKRQMQGCMTKRMSASRTLSYNDAKKACTAQLRPQSDNVPHPLTAAR